MCAYVCEHAYVCDYLCACAFMYNKQEIKMCRAKSRGERKQGEGCCHCKGSPDINDASEIRFQDVEVTSGVRVAGCRSHW